MEPWERAALRREEFEAQAAEYDRHRPRYPEPLFDAVVAAVGVANEDAIDVGAGTGIATEPLVRRGLRVVAIEPAPAMAAVARSKIRSRGEVVVSTFEEWEPIGPVDLLTAFTSWHWIKPDLGAAKAAFLLPAGGVVALVWMQVIQFGQEPFDTVSGFGDRIQPIEALEPHLRAFENHGAFTEREVMRFPFARDLNADDFIALTRTYPGALDEVHEAEIRSLINNDFEGAITKIEDAVLHLFHRV